MTGRYLGLDLGGTNVKEVIIERVAGEEPKILATGSVATHAHRGPVAVIQRLVDVGREAIAGHGPVQAAGVGVPGVFDRVTGVVELFPNLPGPWRGQPLREPIRAGLGVPVAVINDARAFSLAEARLGAGRGGDTVACVTLGTGVGGGIVIGGRLHLGAWGGAG